MGADSDIPEYGQLLGALYLERIIDRKTAGIGMVFSPDLVDDRGILRIADRLCVGRPLGSGVNQTAKVDHVGVALGAVVAAKVFRGDDGTADGSEVCFVVRRVIEMLGVSLEGRAQSADFAQVDQGKRYYTASEEALQGYLQFAPNFNEQP